MEAGDVWVADLRDERRHTVLVLSVARFHRASGRVLVAPQVPGDPDEVPFPWRIELDDAIYAIDLMRSLPTDRLLEFVGRASPTAMAHAQRVLRNIV